MIETSAIYVIEKEIHTNKTLLDVTNQFCFIVSVTIGFRIKPIDRTAFRPIVIIGGFVVRDI